MAEHSPEAAGILRSALRGSAVLATRGILIRLIGLGSNLLLAHALAPSEFGQLAVGSALVTTGTVLSEAGIGAALVRRDTPPSPSEMNALLSLQVAASVATLFLTAILVWLGWIPGVSLLMAGALPVLIVRTGSTILCERRLSYGPLAVAELCESVFYVAWVAAVTIVGGNLYAYAGGVVFRALVGSCLLLIRVPEGVGRPTLHLAPLRPILGFGIRFQGVTLVGLARDQGVNAIVLGVGGTVTLGLWTLAFRIMQGPYSLFDSMWRVSYPALSRLRAAGEGVTESLQTGFRFCSSAAGLTLIPLMAGAPWAISLLFGARWRPDGWVLELGAVGLLIGGPLSVVTAGYLYATGEATKVMWSVVLHTVVWLAITSCLLESVGVMAVGIGWCVGAWVDGAGMAWLARKSIKLDLWKGGFATWLSAILSAGIGMLVGSGLGGYPWLAILISVIVGEAAYCGIQLGRRDLLLCSFRVSLKKMIVRTH